MYKYELWYDGGLLRDSGDLGYIYETEEEANEDLFKAWIDTDEKICYRYFLEIVGATTENNFINDGYCIWYSTFESKSLGFNEYLARPLKTAKIDLYKHFIYKD